MATYDHDYIEPIDVAVAGEASTRGTVVLGIDFSSGQAISSNSDFKKISESEALLQRILKYLHTEKDLYRLFDADKNEAGTVFGFSIHETIGHTYTSVVLSKYSTELRAFLLSEYDVVSVGSVTIQPVEDKILISIYLTSIYGEVEIKEVINNNYYLYGQGA